MPVQRCPPRKRNDKFAICHYEYSFAMRRRFGVTGNAISESIVVASSEAEEPLHTPIVPRFLHPRKQPSVDKPRMAYVF